MAKLHNGATLGAFRILHQIGEGGMAKVYKAFQPSMERYVALKVLPSHFADDPQFVERFIREARTIAQLEHRNILPVYDFGEQDGITYLAMRFVEGGTLKELLGKSKLTVHDALDLMTQICAALDYGHRQGVVHRDVKPSNVILDGEGAAYLMDFGIAKVVGVSGDLTATGAAIGTPAYMAPEQAMGDAVDGRTDIYAMGIVLYEMLVGRVPFRADTPMAVLMAHLRDPLPLPRDMNPDVPEAIEQVIIKALAKDPGDRYQTANELARALSTAVQNAALRTESSTLVTLIKEVQDSRTIPEPSPDVSTDPKLQARIEQSYIDGLSAYWIRDWEKANQCFQSVINLDPNYKDASSRLAEVQKQLRVIDLYSQAQDAIQAKDWLLAQKVLQTVVKLDRSYQDAADQLEKVDRQLELAGLYTQAKQLSEAGQWQAVIRVFERLREIDPDYPDPQKYYTQAQDALAEQERQQKIKETYERGLQAMDSGKWKQAQRLFEQVNEDEPGYGATEQLLQRAADEIEQSRKESRWHIFRSRQEVTTPKEKSKEETGPEGTETGVDDTQEPAESAEKTALASQTEAAGTTEAVDSDLAFGDESATVAVEPEVEDPSLAATQAMDGPMPSRASTPKPRRLPVWLIVGGGLVGIAVVVGVVLLMANFVFPRATPTEVAREEENQMPVENEVVEEAAPQVEESEPEEAGTVPLTNTSHQHGPDENLVDDFNEPGPAGDLDPERWAMDGRCDVFGVFGPMLQDGVLRLINAEYDDILNCMLWPGGGGNRFPGGMLWPFEARLQYAGAPANGGSDIRLGILADYEDRTLHASCGLHTTEDGALTQAFYVWEMVGDQGILLAEYALPADYNRWYTFRMAINPDSMAIECFIEDQLIADYRHPDPDFIRDIPFVRYIQTERLPNVVARTQVDDVYLWPRGEMVQEEPAPPVECPPISGWEALYWNNPDLAGEPVFCQNIENLDLIWWEGSPAPQVNPDGFSAHFSRIEAFQAGSYRFRLGADDGMRLIVDGQVLIDEWYDHPYFEAFAEVEMGPGAHELVVEYFDIGGFADVALEWALIVPEVGCVEPFDGMIGWWSGDNFENYAGEHPVEMLQNADIGMGWVGPSFVFNTDGWQEDRAGILQSAFPEDFAGINNISAEMWVYLDPDEHPIVERFVTIFDEKLVLRKESDGRLHFYIRIDDELQHIWGPDLPRGEWFHAAGTYDGRIMRLYFNGREVGVLEVSGELPRNSGVEFGSGIEGIQGRLDEVTLYNRALSANEIAQIVTAGQSGKCKP